MFWCDHCGWRGDNPIETTQIERLYLDGGLKEKPVSVCPDCGQELFDQYHEEF